MRETPLHPDAARAAIRAVRAPDALAVQAGVAAARELSATVARLIPQAARV